jgi:tetratricopeptide (TPR) repeat protein
MDLFDYVFTFNEKGQLIFENNKEQLSKMKDTGDANNVSNIDILLYPDLKELNSVLKSGENHLTALSEIGGLYLHYKNYKKAENYLTLALHEQIKKNQPNPYTNYYLGNINETNGEIKEALTYYQQAVKFDNATNKNKYFQEAVNRIETKINGGGQ